MSLINQVLSDLDKRGAGKLARESVIRPVLISRNQRNTPLVVAGIMLVAVGVAAVFGWKYWQHKTAAGVAPVAQLMTPPQIVPQPIPQSAVVAEQEITAPNLQLSAELSVLPTPPLVSRNSATPQEKSASHKQAETTLLVASAPVAVAKEKTRNKAGSSRDAVTENKPSSVAALPPSVDKHIKPLSSLQQAENEFRKANTLLQQGHQVEAIAGYETALQADSGHEPARQSLAGLLLEGKRNAEAEKVLQDGLSLSPKNNGFAMLLARLQVERNALPQALETLQKSLPYAGQQADYHAFIAAVQQRTGQHKEAVGHYQTALQSSPNSGIWLMGLGISLKALQQKEDARVAFKRALDSHGLNADLQAFVTQQMKELSE
jgi:MSHA biogenesis protein MshN